MSPSEQLRRLTNVLNAAQKACNNVHGNDVAVVTIAVYGVDRRGGQNKTLAQVALMDENNELRAQGTLHWVHVPKGNGVHPHIIIFYESLNKPPEFFTQDDGGDAVAAADDDEVPF